MSARAGPLNEVGPRDTTPEGTDTAQQIQAAPVYPATRRQDGTYAVASRVVSL